MSQISRNKVELKVTSVKLPVEMLSKINLDAAERKIKDPMKKISLNQGIFDILVDYFNNKENNNEK